MSFNSAAFQCMESSSFVGDLLSPESTVTSLLSSSGHLRSSLRPPDHNTTFRYRDKDYDSASAALDAYIADFERNHRSNESSFTGRLVLPHNPPSTPHRVGILRNKDVLRERLTDRELNFLNLPVSSLRHRINRDRFSMTTDELLSIPYDGSMPVTHTSAFIQDLLSHSAASQPCPSSNSCCRLLHKASGGHSCTHTTPHHRHHCSPPPRSCRCRERQKVTMCVSDVDASSVGGFKSAHGTVRLDRAAPSSTLHLPHWFTSNKADMDCSGITSVPDLKYPAWIQNCGENEQPPTDSELLWDDHGIPVSGTPRARAPSWVEGLEKDDDPDQAPAQVDSQQSLRDLRLQFAEQISLLTTERKGSDVVTTLFKDNKIESLIQKADQVLNSLSQTSVAAESSANPVSPVNTEELVLSSSSHCPPDSTAGGITEALTDTGGEARDSESSFWKQPGPVEALKQMMFRLQAVEAELHRRQEAKPAAPAITERLQTPEKQWPESEAELQSFPGSPSLQRALYHLSRLKLLVEEPRGKRREEEEEEKDEDEGRYSSSSADGLNVSQQKAS
ncbi:lung adenoma susceptibility protein 2 [Pholidichthys leucotaenia]